MSERALAAAISPKVAGSSTIAGKKSKVFMMAISSVSFMTAPSSLPSKPTIISGLLYISKDFKISSRFSAPILALQPPHTSSFKKSHPFLYFTTEKNKKIKLLKNS